MAKDREDDSVHYLNFSDFVENAPTKLTIRLQDDLTHNELADACLEITDEKGEPVETWMTRVDNGYTIRGLSVDKCYTITEKLPREGYLVKFTESYTESGNVELREPEGAKVEFRIPDAPGSVTEGGHLNPASVPETGCIVLENPFVTGRCASAKGRRNSGKLDTGTACGPVAAFDLWIPGKGSGSGGIRSLCGGGH